MAVITLGDDVGNIGSVANSFDFLNYAIITAKATKLKLVDGAGATIVVTGTGFDYANNQVSGGIITAYRQTAADGSLILSMTEANLDAATVAPPIEFDGNVFVLLEGDDVINGGAARDIIGGGAGDDKLNGGEGGDWLVGMAGRDRMTGGGGKDVFVFGYSFGMRNSGADVVTDFRDTGGALDDRLFIREKDYDALTITQSGTDVVLDFGKADLIIRNATVSQIGLDDFVFTLPTDN